jgi:hypothetical protein
MLESSKSYTSKIYVDSIGAYPCQTSIIVLQWVSSSNTLYKRQYWGSYLRFSNTSTTLLVSGANERRPLRSPEGSQPGYVLTWQRRKQLGELPAGRGAHLVTFQRLSLSTGWHPIARCPAPQRLCPLPDAPAQYLPNDTNPTHFHAESSENAAPILAAKRFLSCAWTVADPVSRSRPVLAELCNLECVLQTVYLRDGLQVT